LDQLEKVDSSCKLKTPYFNSWMKEISSSSHSQHLSYIVIFNFLENNLVSGFQFGQEPCISSKIQVIFDKNIQKLFDLIILLYQCQPCFKHNHKRLYCSCCFQFSCRISTPFEEYHDNFDDSNCNHCQECYHPLYSELSEYQNKDFSYIQCFSSKDQYSQHCFHFKKSCFICEKDFCMHCIESQGDVEYCDFTICVSCLHSKRKISLS